MSVRFAAKMTLEDGTQWDFQEAMAKAKSEIEATHGDPYVVDMQTTKEILTAVRAVGRQTHKG